MATRIFWKEFRFPDAHAHPRAHGAIRSPTRTGFARFALNFGESRERKSPKLPKELVPRESGVILENRRRCEPDSREAGLIFENRAPTRKRLSRIGRGVAPAALVENHPPDSRESGFRYVHNTGLLYIAVPCLPPVFRVYGCSVTISLAISLAAPPPN